MPHSIPFTHPVPEVRRSMLSQDVKRLQDCEASYVRCQLAEARQVLPGEVSSNDVKRSIDLANTIVTVFFIRDLLTQLEALARESRSVVFAMQRVQSLRGTPNPPATLKPVSVEELERRAMELDKRIRIKSNLVDAAFNLHWAQYARMIEYGIDYINQQKALDAARQEITEGATKLGVTGDLFVAAGFWDGYKGLPYGKHCPEFDGKRGNERRYADSFVQGRQRLADERSGPNKPRITDDEIRAKGNSGGSTYYAKHGTTSLDTLIKSLESFRVN